MLDAPDFVEEDPDIPMLDVEMVDAVEQSQLRLPEPPVQPVQTSLTIPVFTVLKSMSVDMKQGEAAAATITRPRRPFCGTERSNPVPFPQQQKRQARDSTTDCPTSSVPATTAVESQVPAPAPFIFGLVANPAPSQAAQSIVTAAVTAPHVSSSASQPATKKAKGKVSTSPPKAEPTREINFVVMPGEILRSCCEDWIEACAAFMGTSPLFSTLSQRWVCNWKQHTLVELGGDLGPEVDELAYDHDAATTFARTFFKFNLLRRMDGPDDAGKNAVLDYVGS
ncbi:hypothetical protein C8A05DRAFT_34626 [Staphylotrichum tortipilum]|uniref:Uncharacterized protein n=1 Tax=Staphylotrichum tortipilum TaxID=2831512 RepID=A0AAN6RT89_9PEZI|nr:hypothetical protein C8A05DRAFT_34626 [Staphylotrichum longicolle]